MRSAWVGAGARSSTRCIACSCSVPSGAPCGVALDAAAGRVGRRRGDAGQLERPRVDPRAVVVAVREHRRPVGHDGVERRRGGRCRRGSRPSTSRRRRTQSRSGCAARYRRSGAGLVGAVAALEVALGRAVPAHAEVAVGVHEAGQHASPPCRSTTRVAGPRRPSRSRPLPTATIRPARSPPRRRSVRAAPTVATTAFCRIRSADTGAILPLGVLSGCRKLASEDTPQWEPGDSAGRWSTGRSAAGRTRGRSLPTSTQRIFVMSLKRAVIAAAILRSGRSRPSRTPVPTR